MGQVWHPLSTRIPFTCHYSGDVTFDEVQPKRSWRDRPYLRVLGSAASWFLFALFFTLLYLSSSVVLGLGGFCASGGPYEIRVECPDAVVLFTPLSIFGGLFAVVVSVALAQGFGTPLYTWAWPILFGGLGIAFLLSADVTGYIIGGMFIIMGAVPLVLEFRGSIQRIFLGINNAAGVRFSEPDTARKSMMSPGDVNPDGAVPPTGLNWAASLGILVVFGLAGIFIARLWFAVA